MLLILAQAATPPEAAKAAGETVVETGRVFSSAGIDGLILYALVLSTFLFAAALFWLIWNHSKERQTAESRCAEQSKGYTEAGHAQAEAMRELATAIASSASSNMTFQQAMASLFDGLRERVAKLEAERPPQP